MVVSRRPGSLWERGLAKQYIDDTLTVAAGMAMTPKRANLLWHSNDAATCIHDSPAEGSWL